MSEKIVSFDKDAYKQTEADKSIQNKLWDALRRSLEEFVSGLPSDIREDLENNLYLIRLREFYLPFIIGFGTTNVLKWHLVHYSQDEVVMFPEQYFTLDEWRSLINHG